MRILAAGDMHGNLSIIERSHLPDFDLMICCGDWGDPGAVAETDLQPILDQVHVLTVYGNHDDMGLLASAHNRDGTAVLLPQGQVREYGGLRIAGISGIWAKSHRQPYYVTDEDVIRFAEMIGAGGADVLVSHGCPVGIADVVPGGRHGGQRCFLDAFHLILPRLYLCGHLHRPQRRDLKDGRLIINVGHAANGDSWFIDIDHTSISATQPNL